MAEDKRQLGLKFDEGKLRFDLIPHLTERQLAGVLTFGALKYESDTWQGVEDGAKRYYGSLRRHLDAWRRGEDIDYDTELSHLTHALSCLMMILWFEHRDGKVPDPEQENVQERWVAVAEEYHEKREAAKANIQQKIEEGLLRRLDRIGGEIPDVYIDQKGGPRGD